MSDTPAPTECWGLYNASGKLVIDRDGRLGLFRSEDAASTAQYRVDAQNPVPSGYPPITRGWSIRRVKVIPMEGE